MSSHPSIVNKFGVGATLDYRLGLSDGALMAGFRRDKKRWGLLGRQGLGATLQDLTRRNCGKLKKGLYVLPDTYMGSVWVALTPKKPTAPPSGTDYGRLADTRLQQTPASPSMNTPLPADTQHPLAARRLSYSSSTSSAVTRTATPGSSRPGRQLDNIETVQIRIPSPVKRTRNSTILQSWLLRRTWIGGCVRE